MFLCSCTISGILQSSRIGIGHANCDLLLTERTKPLLPAYLSLTLNSCPNGHLTAIPIVELLATAIGCTQSQQAFAQEEKKSTAFHCGQLRQALSMNFARRGGEGASSPPRISTFSALRGGEDASATKKHTASEGGSSAGFRLRLLRGKTCWFSCLIAQFC